MNVQLANVTSDIVGETRQKIVRAIIAGERDGHIPANLKSNRVRASKDEIEKSLVGNGREEHLFALKQAMSLHDAYSERLNECDRLDKAKAITAAAHKLARLIYAMLMEETGYVDKGQDDFDERYRQRVLHHLTVRARKLGFNLTPAPEIV
jgi:hypothetical protein